MQGGDTSVLGTLPVSSLSVATLEYWPSGPTGLSRGLCSWVQDVNMGKSRAENGASGGLGLDGGQNLQEDSRPSQIFSIGQLHQKDIWNVIIYVVILRHTRRTLTSPTGDSRDSQRESSQAYQLCIGDWESGPSGAVGWKDIAVVLGHNLVEWSLQREWLKDVGVREYFFKKLSKLWKTRNGGMEYDIRYLQNCISLNMYHKVFISWLGERACWDIFSWETTCLMGNDVYQEFVVHTAVNECICGLKKGRPLLISYQMVRLVYFQIPLVWDYLMLTRLLFPFLKAL